MEIALQTFLNGFSYAFILFMLASGLSLVLGVMGVANLAHGSFYVIGAYVGLTAAGLWNNFLLSIVAAAIGLGVLGLVLERLLLARLHHRLDEQVLVTLGLVYIFANSVLWIWGPYGKTGKTPPFLDGAISIGDLYLTKYRIFLVVVGLMLFAFLWWLQDKTRYGATIRAGMDNKEMTIGLGVNYGVVATAVFIVGAMMGGVAGFLGAPVAGVYPGMALTILLLSFIVVVVGGAGSVQGALLGSLVIGLVDAFGKTYYPAAASFMVYAILIVMLVLRPNGLLGRRVLS